MVGGDVVPRRQEARKRLLFDRLDFATECGQ